MQIKAILNKKMYKRNTSKSHTEIIYNENTRSVIKSFQLFNPDLQFYMLIAALPSQVYDSVSLLPAPPPLLVADSKLILCFHSPNFIRII